MKIDVVLIDTAGRMQDNEPLMRALAKVNEIFFYISMIILSFVLLISYLLAVFVLLPFSYLQIFFLLFEFIFLY